MLPVKESAGTLLTGAPALDLHEIQATVLRQRPAPLPGSRCLPQRLVTSGLAPARGERQDIR